MVISKISDIVQKWNGIFGDEDIPPHQLLHKYNQRHQALRKLYNSEVFQHIVDGIRHRLKLVLGLGFGVGTRKAHI